ncbi:MAG: CpXC domain-containing protein [Anaerolineales bacterium]|nr:CpXC domain-containing protein [Anaerolineales bacterium]
MARPRETAVSCPNCGNQYTTQVEQILDVGLDPRAKVRLLSGQVNVAHCPNCDFELALGTPLAYHDPAKELLLVHVPFELNLNNDEQERVIGQFTRAITDALPMEQRKGYLLQPRRMFTMQTLVETVLEADGITKEVMEDRRKKLELVETLLQTPPDVLPSVIAQHDAEIDEEFFTMLSATAEAAMMDGQRAMAEAVLGLRDQLFNLTTYGKELLGEMQEQEAAIQKVTADLNKLGQNLTRESVLDLALDYQENDQFVQALVGLIRPAMDYTFFGLLTERMEQDPSKKTRRELKALRDRLLELIEEIDQHNQANIQAAVNVLSQIVNSTNIEQTVRENANFIDNLFLQVLEANLEDAREKNDASRVLRLQKVHDTINRMIMESTPPEVRFINEVLSVEDTLEARLMLIDKAPQFGPQLLEYLDALINQLQGRGEDNLLARIKEIRDEAAKIIPQE